MDRKNAGLCMVLDAKDTAKIKGFKGVMVACSGGLDSTVLLHNLWEIQKNEKKIKISVCHVNFGLRGAESTGDENFVKEICQYYGIDFFSKSVQKPQSPDTRESESTQEWARRVRYEYFNQFVGDGWAIALAHHKDDLAENILFRLIRGAFPENLLGMTRWSDHLFRPFLHASKKELLTYARRHKLHYRHDCSNDTLDYSRNRIRNLVMPELVSISSGAIDQMIQTAKEAQSYADAVTAYQSSASSEFTGSCEFSGLGRKNSSVPSVESAKSLKIKHTASARRLLHGLPQSPEILRLFMKSKMGSALSMTRAQWNEVAVWAYATYDCLNSSGSFMAKQPTKLSFNASCGTFFYKQTHFDKNEHTTAWSLEFTDAVLIKAQESARSEVTFYERLWLCENQGVKCSVPIHPQTLTVPNPFSTDLYQPSPQPTQKTKTSTGHVAVEYCYLVDSAGPSAIAAKTNKGESTGASSGAISQPHKTQGHLKTPSLESHETSSESCNTSLIEHIGLPSLRSFVSLRDYKQINADFNRLLNLSVVEKEGVILIRIDMHVCAFFHQGILYEIPTYRPKNSIRFKNIHISSLRKVGDNLEDNMPSTH